MFKYALVIVVGSCWFTVGCSSSLLVDGVNVNGMQAWASAHALESCVLGPDGKGVLVPIGKEGDAKVMPISYCNPAE